ncbi:hypothetical protein D9M72_486920 [compost metagenome]
MQNYFGVARGVEAPALGTQLIAQFDIIEDLAVEGDRQFTALVRHRLLAVAETDDRQARMTKSGLLVDEDAVLVWAAMGNRGNHSLEEVLCVWN